MMDLQSDEIRKHVLTSSDRQIFLERGYLTIPGALTAHETDALRDAVLRCAKPYRCDPPTPINIADILGLDDAFVRLLVCPRVFPKVWGILGWNIWVNHTHFNVHPVGIMASEPFMYRWHRDGGVIRRDVTTVPSPMLAIKIGFYLTDVADNGGPTYVVEGSQLETSLPEPTALPKSARPLCVERGTAVIYDNRIVHSNMSPNASNAERVAVFIGYAFRWLQPLDDQSVAHLAGKTDPVVQQLLGLTHTSTQPVQNKGRSGRYYPTDADVPLRSYIADLLGADAAEHVARPV